MDAWELLVVLALGALLSAAATPLVARGARALRIVDVPRERTISRRGDMPLLGGIAVALGFGLALAVGLSLAGEVAGRGHVAALYAGMLLMLALGIQDDRRGLGAWPKFAVQLAAALLAIQAGFSIGHFTDPVSRTTTFLPTWLAWLVSVFWILGITNAINLMDGLDGLATGVGAIIAITLTAICLQTEMILGALIGAALVGALLGFLPFNFAPARIFLGDTGSLFLGYVLALLALEGYRQMALLTFIVPLLALAVPILDTGLSILRRLRRRQPVFAADRLHIHHRLLASYGSHRTACLQVYWVTSAFCLLAVSFTRLEGMLAGALLVAVALLTLRLLRNLGLFAIEGDEGARSPLPASGEDEPT